MTHTACTGRTRGIIERHTRYCRTSRGDIAYHFRVTRVIAAKVLAEKKNTVGTKILCGQRSERYE